MAITKVHLLHIGGYRPATGCWSMKYPRWRVGCCSRLRWRGDSPNFPAVPMECARSSIG